MTYDPAFSKITDDEWREHVRDYKADDPYSWNRIALGARPGHDGCRVPLHILEEFGYPQVFKFEPKQQPKSEKGSEANTYSARKAPWDWKAATINARDLCDKTFPVVKFIVPGLFPEGVTLLVSRPKLGKTWLLLQIGSAVASGVIVLVPQVPDESPLEGDVLYLNLEDGERRAQRRMTKLFGARREMWPARMKLATRWRKFDQGGLDDIRAWCLSVVRPVLVMIDTLKKVRPRKKPNQNDYDADYEACEGLKALVEEFPGLAILVAHHDRKMDADDVFDTVSGTLGLTGGVDTIAILKRRSQRVTLYIESRDLLEEVAKAVRFDRETCRWIIEGEAAEVHRSDERKRVLEALKGVEGGRSPLEIAALANLSHANAKQLLVRMAEAGEVRKAGYGRYCHPDVPIEGGTQTTESDKSDRVTVTETLKTDVVSDGYGKSDKSDSILPDTGVDGDSSKSCHSVTLAKNGCNFKWL
jgi:hypothetical protein